MFATAIPSPLTFRLLGPPLALASLLSCAPLEPPPGGTGGAAPVMTAQDENGDPVPLHALPAWPHLDWEGLAGADSVPLYLFDGPLDEALAQDLSSPPLLRASKDRLVPTRVTLTERGARLSPLVPLDPEHVYSAALMPTVGVSDRPVIYEVRVEERPRSGARLVAALPAALQQDVPFSTRRMVVAFDGLLGSCAGLALHLEGQTAPLSGEASFTTCAGFGPEAVDCCELRLEESLKPAQRYNLQGALVDSHGGPALMDPIPFSSSKAETIPLTVMPLPCLPHEQPLNDGLCVQADDGSLSLRLHLSAPARVTATLSTTTAESYADGLAAGGELSLRFEDLPPDQKLRLVLRATAVTGPPLLVSASLRTLPPLPALTLSEVRSDPLGAEPAQEYVELWNFGSTPIELDGLTLSDDPAQAGQALPASATLSPGARALLVPLDFDPSAAQEPVPSGVRLLRGEQALARSGLANRGEALLLRDAQGNILGAAPGQRTGPGACLQRRPGAPPRSGHPDDFSVGTCTPGE